jgi:hypothetical protein
VPEVDQLHAEAQVGLVGAEPGHGLRVGEHGDLPDRCAGDPFDRGGHRVGDDGPDVGAVGEAHLGVELHELELPVGPEVLVAQAPGDLVVAVEPTHHEQLLEQLGALGQRVELARGEAGRHDEVARPFGGGRDQHRGLDLDEAVGLHRSADRAVDRGPESEVALESLAPQVQVPVAQSQHLVDVGPVTDRDRRWLRRVEHLERSRRHLDRTGEEVGVDRARRALADRAGDPEAVLGPHAVRIGAVDAVGVDHDLDHACGVAQVEEQDAAVVPAAGHPPAELDGLADVVGPEVPGPVRAHHVIAPGGRSVVAGPGVVAVARRSQATSSARGTSDCSASGARRSLIPTTPRSASRAPSMTAYRAPERSASFHWAFTERPP